MQTSRSLPLDGVVVLDCTRLLPGAVGSRLLGTLGARIIKVEPPGGDYGRTLHPDFFEMHYAGTESVALDLTTAAGRSAFLGLAARSDVVYESFRPGVMTRLGLGPQDLAGTNDQLVYCSQSGWGADGPYRDRPGHDINYSAVAGGLLATGAGPLQHPAAPTGDLVAGALAAFLISAALVRVRGGGGGEWIDLSLFDTAMFLSATTIIRRGTTNLSKSADPNGDWQPMLPNAKAAFGIYRCSDGKFLSVACIEDRFWDELCYALGLPEHRGKARLSGPDAGPVAAEIQRVLATAPAAEWEHRLSPLNVCVAPVLTAAETPDDPHVRDRGLISRDEHGRHVVGFPARLSGTRPGRAGPVPGIGADTFAVLAELAGLSPEAALTTASAVTNASGSPSA
jgi:alpha-methylacyl-CoA racemase